MGQKLEMQGTKPTAIDSSWQEPVLDIMATLPGSPNKNDRYLLENSVCGNSAIDRTYVAAAGYTAIDLKKSDTISGFYY